MNEQKKSGKSKVGWVIALIVVASLAAVGWWLWGKEGWREAATRAPAPERPPQAAKPAAGAIEKKPGATPETSLQDSDSAAERAQTPPEKITYRKRVIREFRWNEGDDSLHKGVCDKGDCGAERIGPTGLLANRQGQIYLFDINLFDGSANVKVYYDAGNLIRSVGSDVFHPKILTFDSRGNIFTEHSIYNSEMQVIKFNHPPSSFNPLPPFLYFSEDGKLYFLGHDPIKKYQIYHYYQCDPYSDDLVIDKVYTESDKNRGKLTYWVWPCAELEEAQAPVSLQVAEEAIQQERKFQDNSFIRDLPQGGFEWRKWDSLEFVALDRNLRIYFRARTNKGSMEEGGPSNDYERHDFLLVFNRDRALLGHMEICIDSGSIFTSQEKFLYVEPYSGKVYQLCPDELKPSIIVWEPESGGDDK